MTTRVITITTDETYDWAVSEAVAVLARGGLVAFPTETVYGLAARADLTHAIEKLNEVKNRPAGKPYTLHVGRKSDLRRYVPGLPLVDYFLFQKAWPGPLTGIFQLSSRQESIVTQKLNSDTFANLYHNSCIGMRLPDEPLAKAFLSAIDEPIVAPSANISDQPSPTSAQEVLDQLDGKIDLVLDNGPTRHGQASTIIKFQGDSYSIIRPGAMSQAAIDRLRQVNIMFVCTGNTCRSPMAEGLCRLRLTEKLVCSIDELNTKGYKVFSAGLIGFGRAPATLEAVQSCREMGVDIARHRSQGLTPELVHQADVIYTMGQGHYRAVLEMDPYAENKTFMLGGTEEVADPVGMDQDTYDKCARQIDEHLRAQLDKLIDAGI